MATKIVVYSVEDFLEYLRKSELVPEQTLNETLAHIRETALATQVNNLEWFTNELVQRGLITTWQLHKLLQGKYKGFYLRQYRILRLLGAGGMSTVYLAEHTLMQRQVAIKVLPKHKQHSNPAYLERFVREAQAIASLDHPHIVRAYDVDQLDDMHYIVMEYFDGQNLRQVIESAWPLPYEVAANYIKQGAEGLMYAHRIGVIHRDVKPENLLANDQGLVKILDLGLALLEEKSFSQSPSSTNNDKILGTADYLAPEQAIDSHNVDARADIYALGCTLYFCLTGHAPFPTGSIPQRLLAHQREKPASIFVDRPDAPSDLVAICDKMMEKLPENRFQTAHEVIEVLNSWLIHHGFMEEPRASVSDDDLLGDQEDELISKEISYARHGGSSINLGDSDRHRLPNNSGIFSSANDYSVNLLGSQSGLTEDDASTDSQEFLFSRNSRSSSIRAKVDPLAEALDEIQTGRSSLPSSSVKVSDSHSVKVPDAPRSSNNHPRSERVRRPSKSPSELDFRWYHHVPVWFWAVFVGGYVLATFFAGILFALLTKLQH